MKKTAHFRIFLILLIVFFVNTAMAQTNYVWNGTTGDWATATNWSPNGVPGTNSGDTATISNGGTPSIGDGITPTSYTLARVTITNATGLAAGSTLTINPNATLTLNSATTAVITLNGGNIINNGILNATSTATGASSGIICATPIQLPGAATEYGYSGSGALNVTISASTTANSAAVAVTSLNANTTYKILFNGTTSFSLGSTATSYVIRSAGGTLASPVIIGGTGFTHGTVGSPVNGGLLNVGQQSTVTVNSGTTLTLNSAITNVTPGIVVGNSSINAVTFTNKGTINILGASTRSGLLFTTFLASATASPFVIKNEGTILVNLNCSVVGNAPLATGNGGSTNTTTTAIDFTNTGTLTFINTSTAAGTGAAVFGLVAGQAPPVTITNNGTLNLEGSSYSYGNKFTVINNSILNTNSELRSFTAVTNNVLGSINFVRTAATATTRQVIFNGLASTDLSGAIGSVYTDGTNNYVVVSQKFGGTTTLVANVLSSAIVGTGTGSLSIVSGGSTNPIAFTSVTVPALNNALPVTTTNLGTVNTDTTTNLNIISGVTNASTGVIAPGGASGKGIADFSKSGSPAIASTLRLQVSGSATAGVDFDQITNSATGGGFDISGAILDITSLYTPGGNVSIPIVTATGAGTISGTFASVTGLTTGWTLDYSPAAVNLVFTIASIPTTPTIWTGAAADNNFFNEANWKDSVSNVVPTAGTINPGVNINLALQINVAATITASGVIQFGTGSLAVGTTVGSANLTATSLSGGTVTINEGGYVALSSATPFLNNVQINFTSGIGWIRTTNYNPTAVSDNNLAQIKVNNVTALYQSNLRLDHYYLNGCVIRANLAETSPLTVYNSTNLAGTSAAITVNTLHSGAAIAGAMNNKIESFILKKGFMVTFANEIDGTGKSKNYIASDADLVINSLPATLQNSISFIRVLPWNWVTKKGRTNSVKVPETGTELNTTWLYNWGNGASSTLDREYAPMSWGNTAADDANDIALYAGKYNSTHVMSFNEPDDCNAQSGQYGNLCQTDVAVSLHKNLMKTGMRIVSPGGREEAPFGWLEEFYNKAKEQDIRIDVLAIHWYDWGSGPTTTDGATGDQVFNRFKIHLTNVYNLYGLPIWITEFNANPARSQAVNARFLELALPYLETLDYVERYNWFPYNATTHFSGWDDATDTETDKVLNAVGTIYKNINNTTPVNSTPSIPDVTVNASSNLNLADNTNVAFKKPVLASSAFSTNLASNVVDGDAVSTTSRWLVEFSTKPLPASLEVDLQGSFTINAFRIFEQSNASKNFRFEVWDATLNAGAGGWAIALTVTNNPATPLTTYKTITPVTTTKVRLVITAHTSTDYLRMFELEVYGVPNNPTWSGTTDTNWATASNWSTGIVPDQYSNVTIAGGTSNQPTISASTAINWLTIDAGAELTVTAPLFTVTEAITNSGAMTLANNANLLQGTTFNNTGNINVIRNSNALSRLDYTIWSSPVTNPNQFLTTFSPETAINRFYNYNQTTNLYNAVANPSTTAFATASGYLIRMPNTAVTAPATQTFAGIFTGVPNNGNITKAVNYRGTTPYGYNMIGNPYPSTIDADAFITANTSKIQSSLYFWRKINAATGSAYAVYNSLGSTATPSSPPPNGTIQVGQGFFVKAKSTTTVSFTNAMRAGTSSTQFFKTKQVEKDRVWLNLTTTSGVFSQALIGYVAAATLGVDDFDSPYINDSPIALTSIINNEEYTIQGRPTFDPSDVVALNFKTDIDADYTIALDHFDGVFANGQDVYLLDSKTGIETDLKVSSYTFTATSGIDNTRFSLKYQKTLKVDAPAFNENSVRVYKNNGTLYVNSGLVAISNIQVFDIQGRLISEQKNVKATTAVIKDLKAKHQVLIVKITGEDNNVVNKKVIN